MLFSSIRTETKEVKDPNIAKEALKCNQIEIGSKIRRQDQLLIPIALRLKSSLQKLYGRHHEQSCRSVWNICFTDEDGSFSWKTAEYKANRGCSLSPPGVIHFLVHGSHILDNTMDNGTGVFKIRKCMPSLTTLVQHPSLVGYIFL